MTKHEAQVAHCTTTLAMEAIKSNQYATYLPDRAAKAVQAAEAYAKWLNENGRTVEMEIIEENGQRRILTVTINGQTCVKNGFYVSAR